MEPDPVEVTSQQEQPAPAEPEQSTSPSRTKPKLVVTIEFSARTVLIVVGVVMVVAFAFQMAGIKKSVHNCHRHYYERSCGRKHRFAWWSSASQMAVALAVAVVVERERLNELGFLVLLFLGLSNIQMALCANRFLGREELHGQGLAAAGYIVSIVGNLLLGCILGWICQRHQKPLEENPKPENEDESPLLSVLEGP